MTAFWTHDDLVRKPDNPISRHARQFRSVVTAPDFPCTFTWLPFATGELLYAAPLLESGQFEEDVWSLLAELAARSRQTPDLVAVIFIQDPMSRLSSLDDDFQVVRRIVQDLMVRDPASHDDSARSDWSLTVDGIPIFMNCSSPRHLRRHSRNVGSTLTLICQAQVSFESKGRSNPSVLARIRSRVHGYDDEPPHPALGVIGHANNREAWQIFLGDGVFPWDPTVTND